MTTRNRANTVLTLAALFALSLSANSARADLVAYFPLTDGAPGTTVTGADDIIDDPTHGVTDGTPNSNGDTWVTNPITHPIFDPAGIRTVLSTTENNYISAGTQDIDLNDGFSWSFWANVASSNIADPAADSIIGTRQGAWNKMDLTVTNNWNGGMSYGTLADDTWHHIAYVGDLTGRKIYKDGVEISSDNTVPDTTTNVNFQFGGTPSFGESVTGLYSDIAVWNERLSEERIQDLAAGGSVLPAAIPEPSTVALGALGLLGLLGFRRRRRNR